MSQESALVDSYRAVVCDLDGVIYRGKNPIEHAVDALNETSRAGRGVVYATNNASRTPAEVATQLRALGLDVRDDAVVTSAQAGAGELADRVPAGSRVLAVGGEGVSEALRARGLRPVRAGESGAGGDAAPGGRPVSGVLQGYGPNVCWQDLAEAAYAVQSGAVWVATNDDMTLPTERGTAPGNGSLVAAVRAATATDPVVAGKPRTPLYDLSARVLQTQAAETLAVGDRLDTDILGANRAGMDALLVLTGVHGIRDVVLAAGDCRPRYLAADLRALHEPYEEAASDGDGWRCGKARVRAGTSGGPDLEPGDEPVELLRALVAACWEALDDGRWTRHQAEAACDEASRLTGEATAGAGQ